MAANCGRRTLLHSSAKAFLSRSSPSSSTASTLIGVASPAKPSISATRASSLHKLAFSRLPVELSGAQSLMSLHSVTACALFTSLLSLTNVSWGCLSEGFATTL